MENGFLKLRQIAPSYFLENKFVLKKKKAGIFASEIKSTPFGVTATN